MFKCPCSQDSNKDFEIRAPPRMARRRDGVKGPKNETNVVAASVVVAMPVKNAICSQLYARLVKKKRLFLSNRLVTNLCIAALHLQHVITGKSFIVEPFPGLRAWEGFIVTRKRRWVGTNLYF